VIFKEQGVGGPIRVIADEEEYCKEMKRDQVTDRQAVWY